MAIATHTAFDLVARVTQAVPTVTSGAHCLAVRLQSARAINKAVALQRDPL